MPHPEPTSGRAPTPSADDLDRAQPELPWPSTQRPDTPTDHPHGLNAQHDQSQGRPSHGRHHPASIQPHIKNPPPPIAERLSTNNGANISFGVRVRVRSMLVHARATLESNEADFRAPVGTVCDGGQGIASTFA